MHYHLSEFETMVRLGLPIVTVINNNSGLGQGLRSIRKLYDGRPGNPAELALFEPIDFARIAEVFGLSARRITEPGDIRPALEASIRSGKPCILDVVTDIDCNPEKPWLPGSED